LIDFFGAVAGRLLVALLVGFGASVVWSYRRYDAKEAMRHVLRRAALVAAGALAVMAVFTVCFPVDHQWEGVDPIAEFQNWGTSGCGPAFHGNPATDHCYDTHEDGYIEAVMLAVVATAAGLLGVSLLRERTPQDTSD